MGLLAQRLEETRNLTEWLNDDDGLLEGRMTPAGVRVNARAALGLTTVWRCVDLLSSTVAHAPKDVVLKIGGKAFPEFRNRPFWLTSPDPTDPNYTAGDYFAEVALSLLFDGNFFTHVYPNVFDPMVLTVMDPNRVRVLRGPIYELLNENGTVTGRVGPAEMLHGTWVRMPGMLRGVSPLETLRRGVGSAIAAEDFAGKFFGDGAALSFGVEVPYQMDKNKKDDFRQTMKDNMAGRKNSHTIGVLTDGAKFVTGLAPTPEQAQMLATRQFSVEDLCRPYGVPPQMAGSQVAGAASYASAEMWHEEFRDYAVLPLAVRIESPHQRLLSLPPDINDPNATLQFKFNLDAVARTSLLMRYQAHAAGVQGGILKPREARNIEDLPPLDDGSDDKLYMQRQMVPLDQLGTVAPIPGAAVDAQLAGVPPVPQLTGGTP